MARKAMIAMSGGVDSSVAALLMQRRGWTCVGVTMKLYQNETVGVCRAHTCCTLEDVEDARAVAYALGMRHYVFNFSDRFRETVIERFVRAYQAGCTPNPCIDCNRFLKFETLHRRARELGYDVVATGHYARVEYDEERQKFLLKKAKDTTKDQSYVLYSISQEQLSRTYFPLGALEKAQTRRIAQAHGFVNARKHDSQDLCFVPDGDYAAFLERFTGSVCPPGDFIDEKGHVLGRHHGLIRYTVGQRRGLGLSFPEPMYVKAVDAAANTVTLAPERALYSRALVAGDINLIDRGSITGTLHVKAKVRYRHQEQWASVRQEGARLRVVFDEPQRAITKGQAVVLYDGENVLGGGTIEDVE